MGRIVTLALLLLFAASFSFGWGLFPNQMGQTVADSSPSITTHDFETSTEPSPPTGWSTTAETTTDWDKSTTGLGMEGDQCVELSSSAVISTSVSAGEPYITGRVRLDDLPSANMQILETYNASAQTQARVSINTDGTVVCEMVLGVTDTGDGSTKFAADTTTPIKIRVWENAENDLRATVWLWTGSAWDEECESTGGDREEDVTGMKWQQEQDRATNAWFDYIQESSTDISTP